MSVSLDGFFEGPDREIDWHLVDDEMHSYINEYFGEMSAFLEGRVTYELMAGFWPTADADPGCPAPMAEFAGIWRGMPKIVYSKTLAEAGWNSTIAREVDVDEVEALKALPGGDMVVGGADLAATFIEYGLVDELHLFVNPVVLGRGNRLFPETKIDFDLVGTRTFGNGVVLLRYRR
jgi:dihydrofolate reductase